MPKRMAGTRPGGNYTSMLMSGTGFLLAGVGVILAGIGGFIYLNRRSKAQTIPKG